MSKASKVTSMTEAVSRLVRPGMSLVMGAALEAAIPFAVGHEIIRRGIGGLCLIGPISDTLFDMMIGGGVVGRIVAAWTGNVGTGLGYNFRRAVDYGVPCPVAVEDHSNLSIATALDAGAMGVGFGVTRSLFGTDILAANENLKVITCPFSGEHHVAVRALRPDLAVIHGQRADEAGNTHLWGNLGIISEAVRASRQVLVVVEEVVSSGIIRSDPNRTLIPGYKVAAVVEEPWGAHPSPVQGYYGHDDEFYREYSRRTREWEEARLWLDEWIFGVNSRADYMKKLDTKRRDDLKIKTSRPSVPVDFGF
jgi:glutaconate CoA-transferase, subunit A